MALHRIARGQIAVHAVTLIANVADTVTWQDEVEMVEVLTDGSVDVYVATDGNPATVDGQNCYRIPQNEGLATWRELNASGGTLSIISSGSPLYSVTNVEPGEGLGGL